MTTGDMQEDTIIKERSDGSNQDDTECANKKVKQNRKQLSLNKKVEMSRPRDELIGTRLRTVHVSSMEGVTTPWLGYQNPKNRIAGGLKSTYPECESYLDSLDEKKDLPKKSRSSLFGSMVKLSSFNSSGSLSSLGDSTDTHRSGSKLSGASS